MDFTLEHAINLQDWLSRNDEYELRYARRDQVWLWGAAREVVLHRLGQGDAEASDVCELQSQPIEVACLALAACIGWSEDRMNEHLMGILAAWRVAFPDDPAIESAWITMAWCVGEMTRG